MLTVSTTLGVSAAIVVVLLMVVFWVTNLIGLPGNWLMLLTAVCYWGATWSNETVLAITWVTIVALALLAFVGELAEFLASSGATHGAGGSRRSVALALVGSIVGGIVGLFVALPIPIVGPLIGALLLGGLGAFAGASLGEKWAGSDTDKSLKVGQAAFWGRILGTIGKTAFGLVMVFWFAGALFL